MTIGDDEDQKGTVVPCRVEGDEGRLMREEEVAVKDWST